MYLLRPYPDELLGSLLHRATRQLGLSQRQMMPALSGANISSLPMVITRYSGIAKAHGMDLTEFLHRHTLMPYMTAFMPKEQRDRILGTWLNEQSHAASTSAAVQNATKTTTKLRFCQKCRIDDLRLYGDAYWHRSHQLPGVILCIIHGCMLRVSDIGIRSVHALRPPNEADGSPIRDDKLPYEVLRRITYTSVAALNNELTRADWTAYYSNYAAILGYGFKGAQVIGEVLSSDLLTYYGHAYLQTLDLAFQPGKRNTWPALMFRASMRNSTALKHVLMNVFLASSPTPSRKPTEILSRPKAKSKNWPCIENRLIAKLNKEVAKLEAAGERSTVKALVATVGAKQILHHHRQKVPNLHAWLETFRASPQSERQTGKRPRVYKKPD